MHFIIFIGFVLKKKTLKTKEKIEHNQYKNENKTYFHFSSPSLYYTPHAKRNNEQERLVDLVVFSFNFHIKIIERLKKNTREIPNLADIS